MTTESATNIPQTQGRLRRRWRIVGAVALLLAGASVVLRGPVTVGSRVYQVAAFSDNYYPLMWAPLGYSAGTAEVAGDGPHLQPAGRFYAYHTGIFTLFLYVLDRDTAQGRPVVTPLQWITSHPLYQEVERRQALAPLTQDEALVLLGPPDRRGESSQPGEAEEWVWRFPGWCGDVYLYFDKSGRVVRVSNGYG